MKKFILSLLLLLAAGASLAPSAQGSFHSAFGGRFHRNPNAASLPAPRLGSDAIHRWNQIAIDATGLDHTPVAPGENRVFGEQIGPGRASRAMAIVHIAIFDAIDAVVGRYQSYTGTEARRGPTSLNAAISQAAHDTLVALYPSQTASFDGRLDEALSKINNRPAKANGVELGRRVAAAILALRVGDGSEVPEPRVGVDYLTSNLPGHWRQDPISLIPLALGSHWGQCQPFVLRSSAQFRVPPPPALTSVAYATCVQ